MRPVSSSLVLCSLCFALPAAAQDPGSGSASGASKLTADPMAPGPLTVVPPPVHGPTYGEGTTDDFALTYHGYLAAPFVTAIGQKTPGDDNPLHSSTPLHSLPLNLPDSTYNTWAYTNSQPAAWAHVAMSVGSSHVFAMLYMGAWNFNQGQEVPDNARFAQGALSFLPSLGIRVDDLLNTKTRLELIAGGTRGRYGTSGKYDSGPYGTTISGAVTVIGGLASLERPFGDLTLRFENGFGGSEHAVRDPRSGTLVAHTHLMASYKEILKGGIHYISSWAHDERHDQPGQPTADGSISVAGADVRFNGGVYGELFVGGSMVDVKHAQRVDGSVQVVHVAGGQFFMNNFFGNDIQRADVGTGTLKNVLFQYDYSFGQLARYPENFWGDGPDLRVSLFGMFTKVGSADPRWDNVSKLKYGADVLYAPTSWLSIALRADHVVPNMNPDANAPAEEPVRRPGQSFSILSPRILIRSSFVSHETIGLQYSRYFYPTDGALGVPQIPDQLFIPTLRTNPLRPFDKDVISLKGTMWF
jgi:hypothetical protein